MERTEAIGLPRDMGEVDEAMCENAHVCLLGKRATTRRMDILPARDLTGLPFSPSAIYFGSGCFSGVHAPDVSKRLPHEFSVTWCSYQYTFTTVRRQHDVLCSGKVGGSAHPVHHDDYLSRTSLVSG